MAVYDDLLAWSETRPRWQQEGLRRLIAAGHLTPVEITALADFAVSESNGEQITIEPIDPQTLPTARPDGAAVNLTAIAELTNVNAIANGSRLPFAENGMTLIYGANGSGKSGYVRILRKIVRARAPDVAIHPNVFVAGGPSPSASIGYTVAGEERTFLWHLGAQAPDDLSAVVVYDRDCATVYVSGENEVAYRPFGLDLLDRLAAAVDSVRADLEQRKFQLRRAIAEPPGDVAGTLTSARLWPLSPRTSVAQLTEIAAWTPEKAAELLGIDRALAADDPAARSTALAAVARIYARAATRCSAVSALLRDRSPAMLQNVSRELEAAEAARRLLAEGVANHAPIEGTSSIEWRNLWEAARQFSLKAAYPDRDYPYTDDDARCVYCQQQLSNEARVRLATFEEYVASEAVGRAAQARQAVNAATADLEALAASEEHDFPLIAELRATDATRADLFEQFLTSARVRASHLAASLASQRWEAIPATELDPEPELEAERARLEGDARLVARAGDATGADALRRRRTELRTEEWVTTNLTSIRDEVQRLATLARLNRSLANCSTTGITMESNALTERYVTRRLAEDLEAEARRLGASRASVRMAPRGERGATYHHIELMDATIAGVRVGDVLSEGEFTAIAIAAFLAEIGQAEHASAIVLDDPVSSLDHGRRSKVADRLAEEAAARQVIVFTHDLVFLYELEAAAARRGVSLAIQRLRRDLQTTGIPQEGAPWDAQKVRTRAGVLEAQLGRVRDAFQAGDADRYAEVVRYWYGLLRDTWERAVEEVLLGDVVIRFRPDIKTQSATSNKLWLIEEADIRVLHRAMTRVSALLHDQPQARDEPLPEPQEMADDLQELRTWTEGILTRRRA